MRSKLYLLLIIELVIIYSRKSSSVFNRSVVISRNNSTNVSPQLERSRINMTKRNQDSPPSLLASDTYNILEKKSYFSYRRNSDGMLKQINNNKKKTPIS